MIQMANKSNPDMEVVDQFDFLELMNEIGLNQHSLQRKD